MKEKIQIDGNELPKKELRMSRAGQAAEGEHYKLEFLRQIKESGMDHCSCPQTCRHHGNCYECVLLHRGHRDHLPYCLWDMVNERIHVISQITEGSYPAYAAEKNGCEDCKKK